MDFDFINSYRVSRPDLNSGDQNVLSFTMNNISLDENQKVDFGRKQIRQYRYKCIISEKWCWLIAEYSLSTSIFT